MRTTAAVKPRFWSSGSGRKLRGKKDAQILALYLMSSPHSTMIGLYYESLVSILHETGLTEAEFRAALPLIAEIAQYDEAEGLVYLPNGAEHQVGEVLSIKDHKRKAILAQLRTYGKHRFVTEWVLRYYEPYVLDHDGIQKPLQSPLRAPSMGLSTAPDPRSDPRSDPDPKEKPGGGQEPPLVADLLTRSRLWCKDPLQATLRYPNPHLWPEAVELAALVASTFEHGEPDELRPLDPKGSPDPRVAALLARWAEGTDQARMRQAVRGARHSELIARNADLQTLKTIFKDADAVDKYCRLAKSKDPKPAAKSNVERLSAEAAERRRKFRAGEIG